MRNKIIISLIFLLVFVNGSFAQDTSYIKVHFLYGSKPKRAFKDTEKKWFGGKLGGHVGIEADSGIIIDFVPNGKFHVFAKRNNRHSKFVIHTVDGFWEIFGSSGEVVKKATVIVPITKQQKQQLDSIVASFTSGTPYDYAFIGMRCGAAAYNILGELEVLKPYSYSKTWRKIFYPKKLRKRLFKKAEKNGWTIIRQEGTDRRKWERD